MRRRLAGGCNSCRIERNTPASTSWPADATARHKQGLIEGFTKKYRVHLLVYFETHPTMDVAIRREKRVKEWRRLWKIRLIESMNPEWIDLFDERTGEGLDGPADVSRRAR